MKLIVGLGNPGKKYEQTRHNIGWQVVDVLAEKEKWEKNKKADCLYLKKQISGQETEIIKPLTFMNDSGRSVGYVKKKHKIESENIIVIHDDVDIPFGKIKICQNRSDAGHKGVQSIINHLKTENFMRIRVGIKPEENIKIASEKFVLKNFSVKEKNVLEQTIKTIIRAISTILEKGIDKAMSEYN